MSVRGAVPRMRLIGRIALVCFVILVLFLQGETPTFASTSTWTTRTSNSDLPINCIAYGVGSDGHGLWVTGESNGKIDTSRDGVTWTFSTHQIDPSFNHYFASVVYGNEWVLVGQIGEIVTSPDGTTWTPRTSNTSKDLLGVTYGGGTYVAVGLAGTILTSTDGTHWSSQTAGAANFWSVAYGGGQFVAVADGGIIYTSPDGVTWTPRTSGTHDNLYGVTFGSGLFITAGDNGTMLTSTDAVIWTPRTAGTSNNVYGVTYGAGKFVAVGTNLTIVSSLDGITWSSETPGSEPSNGDFDCVAYGDSQFVVGGGNSNSTSGFIQTQYDSNNANLSGLVLSSGSLSPAFASGITSYTASVPNNVSSVNVTPTLADSTASLKVNGTTATSGSPVMIPLRVGPNAISVLVTAQDGTTRKTYMITITRAQSSNADLSGLTLSTGTLSPTFASGTTFYKASVANGATSVDVTPFAASTAIVKVNGQLVTSGSPATVDLSVGTNTITIEVTAQDGTQKTYTIMLTVFQPVVTQYAMEPKPIAPDGTINAGDSKTVTVTAEDANGAAISGTLVYLSFTPGVGGGSAAVGTTPLTSQPQLFPADSHGQVVITYTAPSTLPNGGTDTITAQDVKTQPSITQTDTYTFATQ